MNKIVNKFLLPGDKYMPELPLGQPGFTYGACGPFTKHPERIKKFEKQAIQSMSMKMNKLVLLMMLLILIVKN